MPYHLKPASVIKAELGLGPNGRLQRFFQNTCYIEMDPFIPRSAGSDGGKLRETVDLSNPYYIVYEMPYASYQYYGIRKDGTRAVKHYTTPGTGPYWDKRMWSVKSQEITKMLQNEAERGGNK